VVLDCCPQIGDTQNSVDIGQSSACFQDLDSAPGTLSMHAVLQVPCLAGSIAHTQIKTFVAKCTWML